METYVIKVYEGPHAYSKFTINCKELSTYKPHVLKNERKCRKKIVYVDGISLHYLMQELRYSPVYRSSFVTIVFRSEVECSILKFQLIPAQKEIVDYIWNDKLSYLVRERCELDHTLSWLSTLGGAFSALGDYFIDFAEIAGKISYHQLQLALRLQDAGVVSRCRLYFSLSLIQRKHFKLAKSIISSEYTQAKSGVVVDNRLISMCKGIWSKLQYELKLHRQCKKLSKLTLGH